MSSFQIIAALMLMVALAILAPPLLFGSRRQLGGREAQNVAIARERLAEMKAELAAGTMTQAAFDQAQGELERSLAADLARDQEEADTKRSGPMLMILLLVALPMFSIGLYAKYGAPEHIDLVGPGQPMEPAAPAKGKLPSVDQMVVKLEQKLEANPEDADGWYLLGRTYMSMQQFDKAVNAFDRLIGIVGDHPAALITMADALAMTQQGSIAGRPEELIKRALAVSPEDPTGNWMAGKAAEERGAYQEAIGYWQTAAAGLQDRPQLVAEVNEMIQAAAAKAGIEVAPLVSPVAAAAAGIQVKVALSPELADKVAPEDVLFVFARAEQGPPMPLAVARLRAGDLPVEVTLDDSMAMMPQLKLSGFERVKISARISKSGQPVAKPGDLESAAQLVQVAEGAAVSLTIDQQH